MHCVHDGVEPRRAPATSERASVGREAGQDPTDAGTGVLSMTGIAPAARVHALCEDYRAGGSPLMADRAADVAAARTISDPTLIVWGEAFLGPARVARRHWPRNVRARGRGRCSAQTGPGTARRARQRPAAPGGAARSASVGGSGRADLHAAPLTSRRRTERCCRFRVHDLGGSLCAVPPEPRRSRGVGRGAGRSGAPRRRIGRGD